MSSNANAVQGDVNRSRIYKLSGIQDLTGLSSVEAHVWNNTTRATLAASVVDATERTVRVNFGIAGGWLPSLPAVGTWSIEIQGTFGDGSIYTWPEGSNPTMKGSADTITVRRQGEA